MKSDVDYRGIRMLDDRRILGPKMLDWAERAKREAARIAPKDTHTYANTLWARKSRGKFSTCTYGSSVHYARFIEYGSRVPSTKQGKAKKAAKPSGTWRLRPHHTLYTAAIAVGMRVRKSR